MGKFLYEIVLSCKTWLTCLHGSTYVSSHSNYKLFSMVGVKRYFLIWIHGCKHQFSDHV